jgi:hypothetical protein
MSLFQFTDSGLKKFSTAYDSAAWAINNTVEKKTIPIDTESHLSDENVKIVDSAVDLPEGPFKTRYGFAEKLYVALGSEIIEKHMFNTNLWSWLACYYFSELCMNKKGEYIAGRSRNALGDATRIILNTAKTRRIYRHLVWGPLRAYYYCGDSSKKLLSKPLYVGGDEYEQIISRPHLVNPAGFDFCNKIGWDSKRRDWKSGFGSSNHSWAVRNIALTLNQLSVNYSISDCETDESQAKILGLFPEEQLTDNVKI